MFLLPSLVLVLLLLYTIIVVNIIALQSLLWNLFKLVVGNDIAMGYHCTHTHIQIEIENEQELDFGTIMCWADNVVGQQKEPCVFHLIAAGKPDMPHNCTLVNQTSESLEVDCNEGKLFFQLNYLFSSLFYIIFFVFCVHCFAGVVLLLFNDALDRSRILVLIFNFFNFILLYIARYILWSLW